MSKLLKWDESGERLYESGVKQGVLYVVGSDGSYGNGVVWNGLTSVTENPSGAESTPLYADDIKYLNLVSNEEFGGSIEAYTYPEEFAICDGSASLATGVSISQQKRSAFGFSYKTSIGNDTDDLDHGYKLHLVYGAKASPTQKAYTTVNESPEAMTFSWDFTTTPVNVTGFKPTAHIVIDSTKANATCLAALEVILYGTEATTGSNASQAIQARLPLPDEVKTVMTPAVVGG